MAHICTLTLQFNTPWEAESVPSPLVGQGRLAEQRNPKAILGRLFSRRLKLRPHAHQEHLN